MADVLCPVCGKPNPPDQVECQFCGSPIKPTDGTTAHNSQTLKPGDQPTKGDTAEFEKAKSPDENPIRPGDLPTKKNTADLERALPSWLRTLREGKRPASGESLAEPSSDEGLPPAPPATPASDASSALPDWLSGLGEAGSEDEEVPDWLAGLRDDKSIQSLPAAGEEGNPSPDLGNEDWMARLGNEPQEPTTESPNSSEGPAAEQPAFDVSPEPDTDGNLSDWLQSLQSPDSGVKEPPAVPQSEGNLPDWLSSLSGVPEESKPASNEIDQPAPAENNPDWLDELKKNSVTPEPGTPAEGSESVPDWLSNYGPVPTTPAATPGENVPDWLSGLDNKSRPDSEAPAALFGSESPDTGDLPAETPDWMSRLQADANIAEEPEKKKEDFEAASEEPASPKSAEPLPEWLSGIGTTTPPSSATPALILDNTNNPPGEEGETNLPSVTPDWLSKLSPEQANEKAAVSKEDQVDSENLEAAELPSWVQAMRPVESVVDQKSAALEDQVTEQNGPLAGLRGVLPGQPGLGALRKPPVYFSKLLVSDGQQRYAEVLERLVAGESNPRTVAPTKLISNRIWRWVTTLLLFLAIGLPFVSSTQVAPTLLAASDKGVSSKIIGGLPANVPVLVAFDYDPALSGEMEAVSAPIMDQLLSKGTPLALISTSPTGPALAEHFLQTTSLVDVHQYQSGQQYVNLGYLAGGSSGMLYLTGSLTAAMPVDVNGKPAWNSGPLQGIQGLSNFAAVIILTDNADTGRNWIEQVGPHLGNTPMLMVISTQAEPMIRPYFDSGQIKGLVSGLPDAKIYEQSYNRPGLAYHYWNSFSFGMLAAELIIVAGVIFGILADRLFLRKKNREEA